MVQGQETQAGCEVTAFKQSCATFPKKRKTPFYRLDHELQKQLVHAVVSPAVPAAFLVQNEGRGENT